MTIIGLLAVILVVFLILWLTHVVVEATFIVVAAVCFVALVIYLAVDRYR